MVNQEHEYEVVQTDIGRMAYNVAKVRLILMLAVVGIVLYCVLGLMAALAFGVALEWASYQ